MNCSSWCLTLGSTVLYGCFVGFYVCLFVFFNIFNTGESHLTLTKTPKGRVKRLHQRLSRFQLEWMDERTRCINKLKLAEMRYWIWCPNLTFQSSHLGHVSSQFMFFSRENNIFCGSLKNKKNIQQSWEWRKRCHFLSSQIFLHAHSVWSQLKSRSPFLVFWF